MAFFERVMKRLSDNDSSELGSENEIVIKLSDIEVHIKSRDNVTNLLSYGQTLVERLINRHPCVSNDVKKSIIDSISNETEK